jgi:hypothetical protein
VERFRNWLRHGKEAFGTDYPSHAKWLKGPKRGKRKTGGFLAWLRELAIYRVSEAGITRPDGLKMLGGGSRSPANWEHAQARTRTRIMERLNELHTLAHYYGQLEGRDLKNYFARL